MVVALCRAGAPLHAVDSGGRTALDLACGGGRRKCAAALLAAGAGAGLYAAVAAAAASSAASGSAGNVGGRGGGGGCGGGGRSGDPAGVGGGLRAPSAAPRTTALHEAVKRQHASVVRLLSEWDAELGLLAGCSDGRGQNPHSLAASCRSGLVSDALVNSWAAGRRGDVSALRRLLCAGPGGVGGEGSGGVCVGGLESAAGLEAKGQIFGLTPLMSAVLGAHAPRVLLSGVVARRGASAHSSGVARGGGTPRERTIAAARAAARALAPSRAFAASVAPAAAAAAVAHKTRPASSKQPRAIGAGRRGSGGSRGGESGSGALHERLEAAEFMLSTACVYPDARDAFKVRAGCSICSISARRFTVHDQAELLLFSSLF